MEEITYIAVPERQKWFEFEKSDTMEVLSAFPLTSRLIKNLGILHAHWSIKTAYYLLIFPIMAILCAIGDALIFITKNIPFALYFTIINLGKGLIWLLKEAWAYLADVSKPLIKKFLSIIGIFLAIYEIYHYIRYGEWLNLITLIKTMIGGLFYENR